MADEAPVEAKAPEVKATEDRPTDELVEEFQNFSIDAFEAKGGRDLVPEFADGKQLYLLFKKEKPLNFLIEFDRRRAIGFAVEGYHCKKAKFVKSSSSSGNVGRLQSRGMYVAVVNPLQEGIEKMFVFAHRANLNKYFASIVDPINVYFTMANFAP
eukprot:g16571.t1